MYNKFPKVGWLFHWNTSSLGSLCYLCPVLYRCSVSLSGNYLIVNACSRNIIDRAIPVHSEKIDLFCCCYLPISSNLLKNSLRKTLLFVLFELLPTGLLKYVWPFVTTPHEWVNNFPGFFWKNINEKKLSWYRLGI